METTAAAFTVTTELDFEAATERCREALAGEGFGVLTEIDVRATLAKKLGVDVPPHRILGACHPPSAYRALTAVPEVGVLLPCNVTIAVEEGRTVVRAMNPRSALGILDHPDLAEVAAEVGAALERVVRSLESRGAAAPPA